MARFCISSTFLQFLKLQKLNFVILANVPFKTLLRKYVPGKKSLKEQKKIFGQLKSFKFCRRDQEMRKKNIYIHFCDNGS